MAGVIALTMAVASGAMLLGSRATARARVQAAADAAALAAAVEPDPGLAERRAAHLALANHVEVVAFERIGFTVVVTVRASGTDATAAASPVAEPSASDP